MLNFDTYASARQVIDRLRNEWEKVATETRRGRELRYLCPDTIAWRAEGRLKADETYVPVRLVDTNVRREQPKLLSYLTQSPRSAVIVPEDGDPTLPVDLIETDYTKKCRYPSWEVPFLRVIDGTQIHGWDAVEVVFDIASPGHFYIEQVGHENLIFDRDSRELDSQSIVLRRTWLTAFDLEDPLYDKNVVKQLIEDSKNTASGVANDNGAGAPKDTVYEIYKVFYREASGQIHVGWYAANKGCSDWLAAPQPLFMGLCDLTTGEPLPCLEYPLIQLRYAENEENKITTTKGRILLDEYDQEGASALLSGFINGAMRASNVYASPKGVNPPDTAPPKQLEIQLRNGAIYDKPVDFFSTPFPPTQVLTGFQALLTKSAQETSSVNYAVNNRPDTEKTATEIAEAKSESQELSGVLVLQLSIFIRKINRLCFSIYQNRALRGLISVPPNVLPLLSKDGQPRRFIILSSGDTDVVKRAEKLDKMMKFWPVVANTPLAVTFLIDILRASFPEDAPRYEAVLQQEDKKGQLVGKLASVIEMLVTSPDGKLKPEFQPYAQQLTQLAQEVYESTSGGNPPKSVASAPRNPAGA